MIGFMIHEALVTSYNKVQGQTALCINVAFPFYGYARTFVAALEADSNGQNRNEREAQEW